METDTNGYISRLFERAVLFGLEKMAEMSFDSVTVRAGSSMPKNYVLVGAKEEAE